MQPVSQSVRLGGGEAFERVSYAVREVDLLLGIHEALSRRQEDGHERSSHGRTLVSGGDRGRWVSGA